MTKEEKDIYIMGSLVSTTMVLPKRHLISENALYITSHIKDHGVSPRTHGNTGKKPRHSLKFNDIKSTVQFISNYADESGLPQPAAPRGRDGVPPVYIPSNMTKKVSILCMSRVTKESDIIWNHCLPHVKIAKLRDDVCAICEKIRNCILDAVTEEDKLEATNRLREHILHAQEERNTYNFCVKNARDTYNLPDA
ncbi:hypothetical protein KUTeg_009135 [Tegillarca granosa]|uniref:Uncharacterized protein n=1 Tax=Tegillarca granosa TaxID=220873 RepID=A0ABQ9F7P0_TEGGR|nr:hypothetical protein KUTeg_009135 [Tegillarca granosa]